MCYIFSCFGWLVDLIQRLVTFFLACWMSCAVCIGLTVAGMAGIAYGYNYQMAEWLTFTRSDVTVYMRRGQFYDRPDVKPAYISRRSGDDESIVQGEHEGGDDDFVQPERYPSAGSDNQALPASWTGVKGAEHFVEKINKYAKEPIRKVIQEDSEVQVDMPPEPPLSAQRDYYKLTASTPKLLNRLISITPNAAISTAVWKSGDSKIIMRNFQISTMKNIDPEEESTYSGFPEDYIDKDQMQEKKYRKLMKELIEKEQNKNEQTMSRKQKVTRVKPTLTPDWRIRENLGPTRSSSAATMIMRHWGPTSTPIFEDYTENVDEDNIVYKPG